MKILLVDPPWYAVQGISSTTVSLGLASLAGVLENAGHDIRIWNGDLYGGDSKAGESVAGSFNWRSAGDLRNHPAYKNIIVQINEFKPDVVGITSMTADFFSACIIARIVHEQFPLIPVVLGGVHPTLVPTEVLQNPDVDYVVCGEGEQTFLELVTLLQNQGGGSLKNILGLAYKDAGRLVINAPRPLSQNLDAFPLPSFRGLIDRKAHIPASLGGIISSRGCPYLCTYCASNRLWTRKVRYRSIQHVLKEVEKLYSNGIRVYRLNDDAFTIRRDRVEAFCDGISQYKDVRWSCDTRVELLDESLIKTMRSSGCYQINIGIESASPRIRKMIRKEIDLKKAEILTRIAQRNAIRVTAYFMIGFPSETPEEMDMTISLALKMHPDFPLFSTLAPYPGTEMWESLAGMNRLPDNPDYAQFYHHSVKMNYSCLNEIEYEKFIRKAEKYSSYIALASKVLSLIRHPAIFLRDRAIIRPQFQAGELLP